MLTDRSPGHADTLAFLDRRLADVALFGRNVGEGLSVAQAVVGGLAAIAGAGLDLVRPMALQGFDVSALLRALQGLAPHAASTPRSADTGASASGTSNGPAARGEYTAAGHPSRGDYSTSSDEFATHAGASSRHAGPATMHGDGAFGDGRGGKPLPASSPLPVDPVTAAAGIATAAATAAQGLAQSAATSVAAVAAAAGIRLPTPPGFGSVAGPTVSYTRQGAPLK
jgi:hypothetical protein